MEDVATKEIKITCTGASLLSINKLSSFQGNLKSLSEKEFKKLKSSITAVGFSFPVFVWRDREENFIIDGHQRLFVVNKMIEDGWVLKDNLIPVDWIEAENKQEAKKKVLMSASQYGRIDLESLYEYIETENINPDELELMIALPDIDLQKFKSAFYETKKEDSERQEDDDDLINRFSIWIKCKNADEQKEIMDRLKLPKSKIYFKEFVELCGTED